MNKSMHVKKQDLLKEGEEVKCFSCNKIIPEEKLPEETNVLGGFLNTPCPSCGSGALKII